MRLIGFAKIKMEQVGSEQQIVAAEQQLHAEASFPAAAADVPPLSADDEKKMQRPAPLQQQQQQGGQGEVVVLDGQVYTKRRPVPLPPQAQQKQNQPPPPTAPKPKPHVTIQTETMVVANNNNNNHHAVAPAQPQPPAPPPQQPQPFTLKLGFVNSANGRYLTAEKFGNRLNVTATSLKQRQMWTLEIAADSTAMSSSSDSSGSSGANDIVYLKSSSGHYLTANIKGVVNCDCTERMPESQFVIEFERGGAEDADGVADETNDQNNNNNNQTAGPAGRWAIRNVLSGAYLGVWTQRQNTKHQDEQPDSLQCRIDRTALVSDSELWHPQLSATPMVLFKNFGRSRYAHLNNDGDAFICSDVVPWGNRSLILLEFYDGKYAIRSAANNKYLHREGALVPCLSRDTLFSLEFKTCVGLQQFNGVVFRDATGACLCASGVGMLRSSIRKTITKDELFSISESHPQVTFTNVANQKLVSIKQGMDVSANQTPLEPDDDSPPSFVPYTANETYQIEIDRNSSKWAVLSTKSKLWSINGAASKSNGVTACGEDRLSPDCQFEATWHEADGSLSIKASNGCYIKAAPTGALQASTSASAQLTDREKFLVDIINRPVCVFRGNVGFIGMLTGSSGNMANSKSVSQRIDCSRVVHDVFELLRRGPATYAIRAVNGKFWRVLDSDLSVVADTDDVNAASWFRFEFRRYGRAAIRHVHNPSGAGYNYLVGEQSGIVTAKGREVNDSTLWEM